MLEELLNLPNRLNSSFMAHKHTKYLIQRGPAIIVHVYQQVCCQVAIEVPSCNWIGSFKFMHLFMLLLLQGNMLGVCVCIDQCVPHIHLNILIGTLKRMQNPLHTPKSQKKEGKNEECCFDTCMYVCMYVLQCHFRSKDYALMHGMMTWHVSRWLV